MRQSPSTPLDARAAAQQDPQRRQWLLATAAAGGVAAIGTAVPLVSSLAPSERARAMGAAVEVNIASLAPGETRVVEWRGKPVWIVRRTPEQLATLDRLQGLADPQSLRSEQPERARNIHRSIRPDIFVAVGICTHLGCSPVGLPQGTANPSVPADWPGGFFCPCHGSTFDMAGRVYANKPAPTNLEIPPHHYRGESVLVVGEAAPGTAA